MTSKSAITLLSRLALLAFAVGAAGVIGAAAGSSWIAPPDVVRALFGLGEAHVVDIVRGVRLPGVLLAAMVGACLGASGASMQGLLRNPLADPYLLGVSGGAALGVAATVLLDVPTLRPLAAFGGAAAAVTLLIGVARALPGGLAGRDATYTLLLTGVMINALAGALILVLHAVVAPARSQELLLWLMGSLSGTRATDSGIWLAASGAAIGLVGLTALAGRLNVLSLGDAQAQSLGVDPARSRLLVLGLASLVVGCGVAFSGLIGFVGLLVPHMVRLRWGADHRLLVPASALAGAAFLVLTDAVARSMFAVAQTSLPVGAVTAVIGAPLFFALLHRSLIAGARR